MENIQSNLSKIVRPWETNCGTFPSIIRPWENPLRRTKPSTPQRQTQKKIPVKTISPNTRTLNKKAIEIMEIWYHQHTSHPYPSPEVVKQIANDGNITTVQVRKWMANKRTRLFNTLSYNNTVHPKRLKRLQRDSANKTIHALPADHFYQLTKIAKSSQRKTSWSDIQPFQNPLNNCGNRWDYYSSMRVPLLCQ